MYKINGKDIAVYGNMVCGNEDVEILKKCLDSVTPYVDVVLVGFNGNDEKIPELFATYTNVKWFKQEWHGDITECRVDVFNRTPDDALLLWIDSDDTLIHAEGLKEFGEEIFARSEVLGWCCEWLYAHDSNGRCLAQLWRERMVWKSKFKWTPDRIHQVLEPVVEGIVIQNEEIKIKHLATIEKIQMAAIRNVNIIQKEYDEGVKAGTLRGKTIYDLARSLQGIQNYDKALKLYQDYIDRDDTIDLEKAITYTMMGDLYRTNGKFDKAKECALKVINLNPDIPDGYFDYGFALYGEGRIRESVAFLEMGFKFPMCKNFPVNPLKYSTNPLRILAFAYFDLHKVKEARACALKVLDSNPDYIAMLEVVRECNKVLAEISLMDKIIDIKETIEHNPDKMKAFVQGLPSFSHKHPDIRRVLDTIPDNITA